MVAQKIDLNELLRMRLIERLPITEIARRFGASRQAVDQRLRAVNANQPIGIKRICIECGKEFEQYGRGERRTCSAKCLRGRLNAKWREKNRDNCACGLPKMKNAEKCMRCCRRFDFDVAWEAYNLGAMPRQIAKHYGVIPPAIYLAFYRAGRKLKGRGQNRETMSDAEVSQMIRGLELSRISKGEGP